MIIYRRINRAKHRKFAEGEYVWHAGQWWEIRAVQYLTTIVRYVIVQKKPSGNINSLRIRTVLHSEIEGVKA